jgi:mannose-6-phosphate isomerase-like protein (cupin superfamily)
MAPSDPSSRHLPQTHDVLAPDGSEVRLLARVAGASMAHFRLPPGAISKAVAHRSVEELWFIVAGRGRVWLKDGLRETILVLVPGFSFAIPCGTQFQFRNDGEGALDIVGTTLPPWPGADEAFSVDGVW